MESLPRWSLEPHGVGMVVILERGGAVLNTEVGEGLGLSTAESRAQDGSRDCTELRRPGTLEKGI